MAETIAVLSLKGGTGKTTTVRTLTDVLRRIGLDVLAVDLDPQCNLSDYFDVPSDASPTVADVLSGEVKLKAAVHDWVVPATPIYARRTRPCAKICMITHFAVSIAVEKQIACAPGMMAVFTPITCPAELISGPPELPGFNAASV